LYSGEFSYSDMKTNEFGELLQILGVLEWNAVYFLLVLVVKERL
jgi:hypothetical protein